jgi:YbgC/YbaW family acyl-CoA thioester hydrolase
VTPGFRYLRRVQFAETDVAGVVHFSWLFRYMEEAEHALWRAAGLSVAPRGAEIGWPRVAASFDFRAPLRFEDEFAVVVRGAQATRRTIRFDFLVERGEEIIGSGSLTAACVRRAPDGGMQAADAPADIVARILAVATPPA